MINRSRNESFIQHLSKFPESQDRQALAVFRRSLSLPPRVDLRPYRYFGRFLADNPRPKDEWLLCLIAGLYALAPCVYKGERKSLGRTLREFCIGNPTAENGVERRLTGLLNAHWSDLPQRLRHTVNVIKRSNSAVDWVQLMNDLEMWDRADRKVQRRWARDFWGYFPQINAEEQTVKGASQEER